MKKVVSILFTSLFILGSFLLDAQETDTMLKASLPIDPALVTGALPNGMRYFIRHNEKPEDRAELRLVVRAGSLQEDPDQLGVAHFVEHMAFNGSTHFEKNELIDYLESVGARFGPDLNAYTSFGETVYMLQARTDSMPLLEKGLLILKDWAGGVSFEPEEVDKERGVVISEWRTNLSPDQRLQQEYFPVLYQDSRYAERLPIGDPEIIDTADTGTIRRFYRDWYRPGLMAVVAVGDFDIKWMEKQIIERFSDLKNPQNPRPRKTYQIPGHSETRVAICTDEEAAFTRIRLVYKHPDHKVNDLSSYREQITHTLYNRMLNGRLFEVQQQQTDPDFTFAYSGYGSDVGNQDVYYVSAFTAAGKALTGLRAVLAETYRAMRHGFLASELKRHKLELRSSVEQAAKETDKQRSGSLAARFVNFYLNDQPAPDPEQTLQMYRQLLPSIELSDINSLPRKWLREQNRVIVVTGPKKKEKPLPSEEALIGLLTEVKNLNLKPWQDDVSDAPLLDLPLRPAEITSTTTFDNLNVTEIKLENGVRVVLKPTDFQNDQILMGSFSPGGHSLYSQEDYQSASNAAALINLGGVAGFPLPQLEKKLAGREVNVGPYISELFEGINGRSSSEDLETMLQLTYLYFTQPRKDSIALASFLSRQRSIVENMFTNPYYYFAEAKNQVKYNNHPRRQMTRMEDLDEISLDRAYDIYRDRFADAGDFTFVLVGNFDPAAILPLIQTYLGNLPAIARQERWRNVGAELAPGRIDTTFIRGKAPKALVELTFHGGFDYQSAQKRYDFYSMIELVRMKLRESMREEKGGVYGVRVSGIAQQHPASTYRITLSFNAQPEEAEMLIQTAMNILNQIKNQGAAEKDLIKIKNTQRQSRIKSLAENGFWQGQLLARYRQDIPLDGINLEVYEQYINGLNSSAIQKAAREYFTTDNFIRILLMPEEGTEPETDKPGNR